MRLSEPITFSVILPYISDFIWDLGVTKKRGELGMYAGIIESLFAVLLTLTVFHWARASDRYGRRPILLIGLSACTFSSLLFGLSTSFAMLVASRCLCGLFCGNVAIYKTVVGEITDKTNTARSMSLLALMWSVGLTIGPCIGGFLSRPAQRYPSVFGEAAWFGCMGLWQRYPYFLPGLVSALINLASAVLGYLYLEETAPAKLEAIRRRSEVQAGGDVPDERAPLLKNNVHTTPEKTLGFWDLISIRHIRLVMVSYAFLALTTASVDAVNVLYFWEPIRLGGLSFPSTITGSFFSFAAVIGVSLQLFGFPYLQKRLGTLKLYRRAVFCLMFVGLLMPWANYVAFKNLQVEHEHHPGGFRQDVALHAQPFVLIIVGVAVATKQLTSLAVACNMLLVNQCVEFLPPQSRQMGTLNGVAQMASTAMYAVGPYAGSSLFALSLEKHLLGGYLIWPLLFSLALGAYLTCAGMLDAEQLPATSSYTEREAANQHEGL
jgi:MFS family permease